MADPILQPEPTNVLYSRQVVVRLITATQELVVPRSMPITLLMTGSNLLSAAGRAPGLR